MKPRRPVQDVGCPAIILAAGASRRMGRNKMLVEVAGESLVRRAVRRALGAGLGPIIVVVGHEPERIRSALTGLDCTFVMNPDYTGPMSGSLHRGLEAVPATDSIAMVMLADMPFVTSEMLVQMASIGKSTSAPLVVSRYGDVLAPPLLFRRALFAELLAWHGEGCGKNVVLQHREQATIFDWPATVLRDIDTPEDLANLRA